MTTSNRLIRPRAGRSAQALCAGFTLIEVMVVLTVLAVIAAFGAPSFRAFLAGQQVKAVSYDLTADLLLARSEALKRNASVTVTPSADGWASGWSTATVLTSEAIASRNAPGQAVAIASAASAPTAITFDAKGRVSSPTTQVQMTLQTPDAGAQRCVELGLSGRARSFLGACPS